MSKAAIIVAAVTALTMSVSDAQAQTRSRTTTVEGPRGNSASRSVTVERWHRPVPPRTYSGSRAGHFYAPGYGYYRVTPDYYRRRWVVGAAVPPALRRYAVVNPAIYRLPPAPPHLRWIYVGNRIALVRTRDGVIVQLGPVFW
jgi:Ni/Co efflux regulator RcnB